MPVFWTGHARRDMPLGNVKCEGCRYQTERMSGSRTRRRWVASVPVQPSGSSRASKQSNSLLLRVRSRAKIRYQSARPGHFPYRARVRGRWDGTATSCGLRCFDPDSSVSAAPVAARSFGDYHIWALRSISSGDGESALHLEDRPDGVVDLLKLLEDGSAQVFEARCRLRRWCGPRSAGLMSPPAGSGSP